MDIKGIDCATAHELLSARLDGEASPLEAAAVGRHLATCPDCAVLAGELDRVHRAVRLRPADEVPDLSASILRRVSPPAPSPAVAAARPALALLAAGQLVLTLLTLGHGHSAHDTASWELALAVAFAWAAVRPTQAARLAPVIGVVAIVQLANAVIDVTNHAAGGVGHHLVAAAGWYLLEQLRGGHRLARAMA
jgi:predicted anti-sigma-YlaC factor YlaD